MELKIKLFILFLVTYISQVKTINLINSDSRYLLLLIFLFYLNLSEVEWFVHTYLMHAENDTFIDKLYKKFVNDDHKQHHRSINTDMTIISELQIDKGDDLIKNEHVLSFIIINLTIQIMFLHLFSVKYTKENIYTLIILNTIFGFIFKYVWNIIHPSIHYEVSIPDVVRNTSLFKYMARKHTIHHLSKDPKKVNNNVAFPFVDYVLGTNKNCVGNLKYFQEISDIVEKDERLKKLKDMEIKNEPLPYDVAWETE